MTKYIYCFKSLIALVVIATAYTNPQSWTQEDNDKIYFPGESINLYSPHADINRRSNNNSSNSTVHQNIVHNSINQ